MMRAKAVLDFVGFPPHDPGVLECRLARTLYRDDGTVIDQGARSGPTQRNVHRFPLHPGDDIEARVADQVIPGYEQPDTALLHHIAAHEWREDVLAARRARLDRDTPTPVLVLGAVGFDLIGAGELAVQVRRVTIGPDGPAVTAKARLLLLPGDPLDLVIEAVNAHAQSIDYEPMDDADAGLLHHVAAAVHTPEAIARREAQWRDWTVEHSHVPLLEARSAELVQRLAPLGNWLPVPVSPELMRLQ